MVDHFIINFITKRIGFNRDDYNVQIRQANVIFTSLSLINTEIGGELVITKFEIIVA